MNRPAAAEYFFLSAFLRLAGTICGLFIVGAHFKLSSKLSARGLSGHTYTAWGHAKAFRQTIHRMVCLHCLLTFPGERFAFLFLWGLRAPTPRAAFEKAGETFNF